MAVTGKREYWDEIIQKVVPVASTEDAISGRSLRIPLNITPNPIGMVWAMQAGDSVISLFENEATEIIFSAKLLTDSGSEGQQLLAFIRADWPDVDQPPLWAFVVGIIKTASDVSLVILRFISGSPDPLFLSPLVGNEGRFRIRSDDDGALVRLQIEKDFGGLFLPQYLETFDDMAPLIGEVNQSGFLAVAGSPVTASDVAILDNIQLDNQPVVPPEPIDLPFVDGFEDESWEP